MTVLLEDGPPGVGALGRAARAASGEFLWLAEPDGLADPAFVATLAALMQADPRLVCAFCEARAVDDKGRPPHRRPSPLTVAARRYPRRSSPLNTTGAG